MSPERDSIEFTCKVGNRENLNGIAVWSDCIEFSHLLTSTTDNKESLIREALYQFEKKLRETL